MHAPVHIDLQALVLALPPPAAVRLLLHYMSVLVHKRAEGGVAGVLPAEPPSFTHLVDYHDRGGRDGSAPEVCIHQHARLTCLGHAHTSCVCPCTLEYMCRDMAGSMLAQVCAHTPCNHACRR